MPTHYRTGTETIEIAARRHFFAAAPDAFGCCIMDLPGTPATLLSVLAMPSPTMNRVLGLPGDAPLSAAALAQIRQVFRERGIPHFWLHAWNTPDSSVLHESLLALGCQRKGAWAKFERGLEDLPALAAEFPYSLRLARADEYGVAGQILADSFSMPLLVPWMEGLAGRPEWQVFFACDDEGTPVATGTLLIDGKDAWLGMGGTLQVAQRRGCQQAMLALRLAAAKAAGCVMVSVEAEAPEPGQAGSSAKNILRAGFRQIGTRQNYLCQS
ncbi:hypothetical protein KW842_13880 [Duganella sp. sic0402]|uniref:hypothetical protein n=1 Tax=Duganella sp. sic0402 TaxID=2854786 RepID=UPI001C447960|nr:hypothetical protein [Duganella sp. sic0402]MBV7536854.1 hypothetical protein [Duganella sp. sic0402]